MEPIDAFPALWKKLRAERPEIDKFNHWFDDEQPKPEVKKECNEAYQRLLDMASENWAGMIVTAPAERLRINGMRFDGDSEGPAWDIWQANGMDSDSDQVHLDALISGRAPVMVVADDASPVGVSITPEDPRETIVLYAPGGRRVRVAALKTWVDLDNRSHAAVWTAGQFLQGVSKHASMHSTPYLDDVSNWDWAEVETGPAEVPVIELHANARTGRPGRSEMAPHLRALRSINLLGFDLLLAAEFAAYRQRWVTGLELDEDEAGNPKQPFRSGVDQLFVGEDADIKFGEFGESNLTNYIKAIEYRVGALAARSKTPAHYVATSISNVSADTIRALESGLVAKCERHQRAFGEAWESVMRLALSLTGYSGGGDASAEILWADPRTHTDGQLADALTKKMAIGIPQEALWEMDGASPQTIAQWRSMQAAQMLLAPSPDAFAG